MARNKNYLEVAHELEWAWPFGGALSPAMVSIYAEKLFSYNSAISDGKRKKLLKGLRGSYSLSLKEKQRVLSSLVRLSEDQINKLITIFNEEKSKFAELNQQFSSDIKQLSIRRELDWALLLNKENGVNVFWQKYVYAKRFSRKDLIPIVISVLDDLLSKEDYLSVRFMVGEVLSNKPALKYLTHKQNQLCHLINAGTLSSVEVSELNGISGIEKIDFLDARSLVTDKSRAGFIEFVTHSYQLGKYGIPENSFGLKKKLLNFYKLAKAPADLSSWFSYLFLCQNDYQSALNAARWSLRKVVDDNLLNEVTFAKSIGNISHQKLKPNFNFHRNLFRYLSIEAFPKINKENYGRPELDKFLLELPIIFRQYFESLQKKWPSHEVAHFAYFDQKYNLGIGMQSENYETISESITPSDRLFLQLLHLPSSEYRLNSLLKQLIKSSNNKIDILFNLLAIIGLARESDKFSEEKLAKFENNILSSYPVLLSQNGFIVNQEMSLLVAEQQECEL